MQGEPVPAPLPGRQGLAAPLAVEPGLAGHGNALPCALNLASHLVERLAVVVRRLALAGFFAVALQAMQHQRFVAGQLQVVGKALPARAHAQTLDAWRPLQ